MSHDQDSLGGTTDLVHKFGLWTPGYALMYVILRTYRYLELHISEYLLGDTHRSSGDTVLILKNRIARNLSIAKKISPECVVPLLFSRRVLPSSSVHSDAKRKGAPSRPATTEARTGNALQGALESENGSI